MSELRVPRDWNAELRKQAFFDRLATTWSKDHYGPQGDMAERTARFAGALEVLVPTGASILDYGCGTGDIAAALAERGYRVEARDKSAGMITQARALHAGSTACFFEAGSAVPGRFDAVICSSVLEYVYSVSESLRELAGALKPGGWLLATVPDVQHPLCRREALRRAVMSHALLRSLIRIIPRTKIYELNWLSHNRMSIVEWAAMFKAAKFHPVWRSCEDHPLMLLVAQKRAILRSFRLS
jgi:2-polyprenyl-3-methyl-5-hydroxy-6-metoxy-1,4-benzoquinol methylase